MDWDGGGRKDGYEIREEYISTKGVILGFTGDLIINGIIDRLILSAGGLLNFVSKARDRKGPTAINYKRTTVSTVYPD